MVDIVRPTERRVVSTAPCVADCVNLLDALYDPRWAEPWDAVGLVVGNPASRVERVLLAVDPTEEVAREAVEYGAQLLVTHHALFLRGVHGVPETTAGGRVVATLVPAGCALFTAHTNADVAVPGVSDALATVLGLAHLNPLVPAPAVPGGGLGRVGSLPEPEPLSTFLQRVAIALPATAGGVRATGPIDRAVQRVAVCGGSGGELAEAAAAIGADVLLTADSRHHHTLDAISAYDLTIVDVSHWASEWPWLEEAAGRLRAGLAAQGRTVSTAVSARVTDPWRLHAEPPS